MKISVEKEPGTSCVPVNPLTRESVRAALDSRARMVVVPIERSFLQGTEPCNLSELMAAAVDGEWYMTRRAYGDLRLCPFDREVPRPTFSVSSFH
jgi:hypothetical protein